MREMKIILISLLIICIAKSLAFNITDFTNIFTNNNDKTSCGLNILKYTECISKLSKATKSIDINEIKSDEICPVFEDKKCTTFVNDSFDNINCDGQLGELTKYTLTLYRLYYLTYCYKSDNGDACPISKMLKEKTLTLENTSKYLEEQCKDSKCNKSFVALCNIMDKNISSKQVYKSLIGFSIDKSYKSIAKSFSEGKCNNINFISVRPL